MEMLTRAIVVWTGWRRSSHPDRNDQRLLDEFGEGVGPELLRAVKQLEDDFYSARFVEDDLALMGGLAADQFRVRHPEIDEEAVKAFTWCHIYDFK